MLQLHIKTLSHTPQCSSWSTRLSRSIAQLPSWSVQYSIECMTQSLMSVLSSYHQNPLRMTMPSWCMTLMAAAHPSSFCCLLMVLQVILCQEEQCMKITFTMFGNQNWDHQETQLLFMLTIFCKHFFILLFLFSFTPWTSEALTDTFWHPPYWGMF